MKLKHDLIGRRIIIRNYQKNDLDFLTSMWFDKENGKYMSDPTKEYVDDTYQNALNNLEDSSDGYYLVVCSVNTGEKIGSAGIFQTENDGVYDIGYCIHKSKWQQGFGSEIIRCLLEWATSNNAKKITAEVAADNIASNKLLLKFGFNAEKESQFNKYNMNICFKSYIYSKNI